MSEELKQTALYDSHLSLNARMVPFAGWMMPVQYSGILNEVRSVRTNGGIFDVSHMGRLYISGTEATQLLDWLLTGHIAKLKPGRARYSLMCNEAGGVIDDTVTYRLSENKYLLICNASNRSAVTDWINWWIKNKYSSTQIEDATLNTSMIAVQGPYAASLMDSLCLEPPSSLKFFSSMDNNINGKDIFIGRTGYTGEDGFEIVVDSLNAPEIWNTLVENGMVPCGLGSRDILRLEASLPLHGSDITPEISPLEAGLNRFVKLDKDFVGSDILKAQDANGVEKKLIGLIVQGRNLPRHNYSINSNGTVVGIVTSGAYSPTLDRNIAMGYVSPEHSTPLMKLEVDIRGRIAEAEVTALPFYSRKRD